VGCYIWYTKGTGQSRSPPRPLLAVPNATIHPSVAGVPITILLYSDPLLCGFNVPVKGLNLSYLYTDFYTEISNLQVCSWTKLMSTVISTPKTGMSYKILIYYTVVWPRGPGRQVSRSFPCSTSLNIACPKELEAASRSSKTYLASRQGFGELKTEQLGGHSQEQQCHGQAPID